MAATAKSNGLSAGVAFLTRAFCRLGLASKELSSSKGASSLRVSSTLILRLASAAVAGGAFLCPVATAGAVFLGGTGILMVEAALVAPAAAAGGTEILIVGEAAGLGGRLMRTVCFLDSCEPPAAGGWLVSSDIVQKFKRTQTLWKHRRSVKRLKLMLNTRDNRRNPCSNSKKCLRSRSGCKPNSVCASRTCRLRRGPFILCDPTRSLNGTGNPGLPIWSCSQWGLPCPLDYSRGGGLLPHLFTLTRRTGRFVFCCTGRRRRLKASSPACIPPLRSGLRGIVPCGVRTFLPRQAGGDPPPSQDRRTPPSYRLASPQTSCLAKLC